jgi:hypothetical protein
MKKIIITSLVLFFIPFSLLAGTSISNIKPGEPTNGQMSLSWNTNEPSTSYVFFGFSPDHMPFYVGSNEYKRSHSAELTGLKKDTDYYYKIMVTNQSGQVTESYTNYFNTKGMSLSSSFNISNFKREQVIDQAIAFSFNTSRSAKVLIEYGYDNNLNKTWRNNSYKLSHQVIIKNLEPGRSYNFKITATDEDDNYTSYSFRANTSSASFSDLKLENLKPSYQGELPIFSDQAIISFDSNILSIADIYIGTKAEKLKRRIKVSSEAQLKHYITIDKLEANTNYYYQVKLSSALNNLKYTSPVYSFKTKDVSTVDFKESIKVFYHNGDLVSHGRNTYIIYDDYKFKVEYSPLIAKQETKDISQVELAAFQLQSPYLGPYREGQILRVEGDRLLYVIYENTRRPLASWEIFFDLNYQASDINIVSKAELNRYKLGKVINRVSDISLNQRLNNRVVSTKTSSTVYLLVNDKKLPFLSAQAFLNNGYSFSQIVNIAESDLNKYQTATPIF